MGGDRNRNTSHLYTEEEINSPAVNSDFPQLSSVHTSSLFRNNDNLSMKWGGNGFEEGIEAGRKLGCHQPITNDYLSMKGGEGNGLVFGETNLDCSDQFSLASWDSQVDQRRKNAVFREVLQSYDQLRTRIGSLSEAKNKILSYTPGAWIENVRGMTLSDYEVPKTTSLVLIGPKGSGKSSLVNRISKVFEDDKFAPDRAQVTYSSAGDGTYFLQEYMIPRGSNSFSLYDTRSLSDDASDNINMIKHWIMEGVSHGELVIRKSDSCSSLRNSMKWKAREIGCEVRMVNFVLFVVDGLKVLKSMEGNGDVERYNQMIATTFNSPYLSFRDDKPVVIVTHGDLLSLTDRARIRTYLGELLGIPPAKQIFDIPESCDPENELIIVDMLRYCLEHADRNLSTTHASTIRARDKGLSISVLTGILLLLILGIAISTFKLKHLLIHLSTKWNSHVDRHVDSNIDWHAMLLEEDYY